MDTLSTEIARKVSEDTNFWIAVVGLVGVIIGAFITVIGNILLHWLKDKPRRELDEKRKKILKEMLNDSRFKEHWRNMTTLSRVIGADEETTKRLLIEINARGSEKDNGLWGLIKNHPFNKTEQ